MRIMRQWMQAVILTCGMAISACTEIDNPVPNDDIYSQSEDKFGLVPANEGDPAVVAALKSLPNVTDVKPFMNLNLGQAYYFNYLNPIDHNNPSLGTYKQQVVLTYSGENDLTILHTEGYALAGPHGDNHNRLDSISAPNLLWRLSKGEGQTKFTCNCVQVEYRYHGFSLPEGDEDSFKYLNAEQQSKDLHNIVTDLKKVLLKGKWLSTGVSKNGMATAEYGYYFPGDIDVYVPFVAPFSDRVDDMRIGTYMITKATKPFLPKIKAAFEKLVNDKDVAAAVTKEYQEREKEAGEQTHPDSLFISVIAKCYGNLFDKQSYGDIDAWSLYIPDTKSKVADYVTFFFLDKNDTRIYLQKADTRTPQRHRRDPYNVQVWVDQGGSAYDYSWILNGTLLTEKEKAYFEKVMKDCATSQPIELGPKLIKWLETTSCPMFFVYGENDPWTGGAIPDEIPAKNPMVKKYVVTKGTHNDDLDNPIKYPADEAKQILDDIKKALGI